MSRRVNFVKIDKEHPEWMNAYNNAGRIEYWYQYKDMEVIGRHLFDELSVDIKARVELAAPLGQEYDVANLYGAVRSRLTQVEQLKKFIPSIYEEDKKVVGVYNTEGNHWITYHIEKDESGIRCIYKDSQDRDRGDFEGLIRLVFGSDDVGTVPIVGGAGELGREAVGTIIERVKIGNKEQSDGSNCGLFALQNMMVFAREELEFYKPESIEALKNLRREFGEIYLQDTVSMRLGDILLNKHCTINSHKVEELKNILQDKLNYDLMSKLICEIVGDRESSSGYVYQIRFNYSALITEAEITALKKKLVKLVVQSPSDIMQIVDGTAIKIQFKPEDTKIKNLSIAAVTTSKHWLEDIDLDVHEKMELLGRLVLELRPFGQENIHILEEVCIKQAKIGEEARGYLSLGTDENGALLYRNAAENGDVELVEAFLMSGSSANAKFKRGDKDKSILKLVCNELLDASSSSRVDEESRLEDVAKILIDSGAKVDELGKLRQEQKIQALIISRAIKEAKSYTDEKVSIVRADLDSLEHNFRKHIESIPTGTRDEWAGKKLREDRIEKIVDKLLSKESLDEEAETATKRIEYTGIIGSFCKYMQVQMQIGLAGIKALASDTVSISSSGTIISEGIGLIPYVGHILKSRVESMHAQQKLTWVKEQALHIVSSEQEQVVIEDYVSFVAKYKATTIIEEFYKEHNTQASQKTKTHVSVSKIIKYIQSIGSSMVSETFSRDVADEVVLKVPDAAIKADITQLGIPTSYAQSFVSRIVNKFEDIFFDKRVGDNALVAYGWKDVAGIYVTNFMDYLLNYHVRYDRSDSLGEDAAKEILPAWVFMEDITSLLARSKTSVSGNFNIEEARSMSLISALAYKDKEEILDVLGKDKTSIIEGHEDRSLSKSLRVIITEREEDLYIAFIDNGHSWYKGNVDMRSINVDVTTKIETKSDGTIALHKEKLDVHRGFFGGASELWNMEGGIKSKFEEYDFTTTKKIYMAGHAVGGAIALATYLHIVTFLRNEASKKMGSGVDLKSFDDHIKEGVVVYTYGQPRFFKKNLKTKNIWEKMGIKHYRIVNDDDIVPKCPSAIKFEHYESSYHIGGVKKRGEYEEEIVKASDLKIRKVKIDDRSSHSVTAKIAMGMLKDIGKLISAPELSTWFISHTTDQLLRAHDIGNYYKRLLVLNELEESEAAPLEVVNKAIHKQTVSIIPSNTEASKVMSQKTKESKLTRETIGIVKSAIDRDDYEVVKNALDGGFDLNTEIVLREDIVSYAMCNGKYLVLRLLAEDMRTNLQEIHRAVILGDTEKLGKMCESDTVNLEIGYSWHGFTPSMIASIMGNKQILNFLITEGADIDATGKDGRTMLHLAAENGHVEIVRYLVEEKGLDINAKYKDRYTPLHFAVENGHVEIVRYLVEEKGIDIKGENRDDWAVLHLAARGGLEMVRYLVEEHGLDPNAKGAGDSTALHWAASSGYIDMVRYLVEEHGLDPNAKHRSGYTAFHYAAENGHVEIVEYLIKEKGFHINSITTENRTALHLAAIGGHLEVIKYLVEEKSQCVNINAKDSSGYTAFHYAASGGHVDLVRYLVDEESTDVSAIDGDGRTVLHLAAKSGHIDVVRCLVEERNLDIINIADKDRYTPLHFAVENGHVEIVQYLVKYLPTINRNFIEQLLEEVSSKEIILLKEILIILENEILIRKATDSAELYSDSLKALDDGINFTKQINEGTVLTEAALHLDIPIIVNVLSARRMLYNQGQIKFGYQLIDVEDLISSSSGASSGKIHKLVEYIKDKLERIGAQIRLEVDQKIDVGLGRSNHDSSVYKYLLLGNRFEVEAIAQKLSILNNSENSEFRARGAELEKLLKERWALESLYVYYMKYLDKFEEKYGYSYKYGDEFRKAGASSDLIDEEKYIGKITKIVEKRKPIVGVDIAKAGDVYEVYPADLTEVEIFEFSEVTEMEGLKEGIRAVGGAGSDDIIRDTSRGSYSIIKAILNNESGLSIVPTKPSDSSFGNHILISYKGVHYKYWPYAPGIEFTVNSLNKILLEDISLPSKIIKLVGKGAGNFGQVAIYQAARTVEGENFHYLLDRQDLFYLIDKKTFAGLFISSLLTRAGDAKPDNFMVRLIKGDDGEVGKVLLLSIDNDISFCKGSLGFKKVGGKGKVSSDMANILFFLPQMDEPLDGEFVRDLLGRESKPEEIISEFLGSLYEQNKIYSEMIIAGFLTDEEANLLKLPIKLPSGTIGKMYKMLKTIFHLVSDHEVVTPNEIFRELYPGIAYYYEKKRVAAAGDVSMSIRQVYIDSAGDETLADKLLSADKLASRKIITTLSMYKMRSNSVYNQIFNKTVEKLALEFLDRLDFADDRIRGWYGEFVCKSIGNNLKFMKELILRNINEEQLGWIIREWLVDGIRKPDVLIEQIKIVSDGLPYEDIIKSADDIIGSKLESDLNLLSIDLRRGNLIIESIDTIKSEAGESEKVIECKIKEDIIIDVPDSTLPPSSSSGVEDIQHIFAERFSDLLEMSSIDGMSRDQTIEFARCLKEVRQYITKMDFKTLNRMLHSTSQEISRSESKLEDSSVLDLTYKDQLIAMMLQKKQLSIIVIDLVNKHAIALDDIKDRIDDGTTLLHRLLQHPKWLQYTALIEVLAENFPEMLSIKYRDSILPADIAKKRMIGEEKGEEILSMLLNKRASLESPDDQEKLIIHGVLYGLKVTESEVRDGIYNHYKTVFKEVNGGRQEWTILHFAIEEGNVELFDLAFSSYEIHNPELLSMITRDLYYMAIDSRSIKSDKRSAEIIEKIYYSMKEDRPDIYEEDDAGNIRLIGSCVEDGREHIISRVIKLYKKIGWNISIKEAIDNIDINKTNELGNSLLYELIKADDSKFKEGSIEKESDIKFLIDNREFLELDINETDRYDGYTPLELAKIRSNNEIVRLLESILTGETPDYSDYTGSSTAVPCTDPRAGIQSLDTDIMGETIFTATS